MVAWHKGLWAEMIRYSQVYVQRIKITRSKDDDDIANAVSDGVYSLTHSSHRDGGNEDKRCIAGKFLAYGKLIFLIFGFNAQ